MHDIVTEMNTF